MANSKSVICFLLVIFGGATCCDRGKQSQLLVRLIWTALEFNNKVFLIPSDFLSFDVILYYIVT